MAHESKGELARSPFTSYIKDVSYRDFIADFMKENKLDITAKRFALISSKSLPFVSTVPFSLTYQTSGQRLWLLLFKKNEEKQAILMDTKLKEGCTYPKMYQIRVQGSDGLFNGNLISLEYIDDSFIVSDIILSSYDSSLATKPKDFATRYMELSRFLSRNWSESLWPLRFKHIWPISKWQSCIEFMTQHSHKMRCLELHNPNPAMKSLIWFFSAPAISIDTRVEQYKKIMNSTADVPITREKETDDLFLGKTDTIDVYRIINKDGREDGYAYIRGIENAKMIRAWFKPGVNRVFCRCRWNSSFDKWEPVDIIVDRV